MFPFFLRCIYAGLVPLFSPFFRAILEHYHIHVLHLQPDSVTLLAIFAFACEAFLGVAPSVALFRHFFSLRISAEEQCSSCASFLAREGTIFFDMNWKKKVEDCRSRWVYMDRRICMCG